MRSYLFLIAGILLFTSTACKEDGQKSTERGRVHLMFSTADNNIGRENSTNDARFVVVTIKSVDGTEVCAGEKLSLLSNGDLYVSLPLQLATGTHKLVEFLVLDSEDNLVYAAPKQSSPMAGYVMYPLPLNAEVAPGINHVHVEVLPVIETDMPERFGYVDFID